MSDNKEKGMFIPVEEKKFVPADEMEFPAFKRVQVTEDFQKDTTEIEWQVIRDDCESGGAMTAACNIVAASMGTGSLDVVAKRLSCGCTLIRDDIDYSNESSE